MPLSAAPKQRAPGGTAPESHLRTIPRPAATAWVAAAIRALNQGDAAQPPGSRHTAALCPLASSRWKWLQSEGGATVDKTHCCDPPLGTPLLQTGATRDLASPFQHAVSKTEENAETGAKGREGT